MNALSQLTQLTACLIALTLALEKFQILCLKAGGKKVVKLTFVKFNWWWQLENSERRTPESVTKLVSVVIIKSIQDAEWGRMWVGPSMTWFELYCAASSVSSVPCRLVESPFHHSDFQALKSPIYAAIVGEQSLILMIASSHLCLNKENCSMLWLGGQCRIVKKKRLEPVWV